MQPTDYFLIAVTLEVMGKDPTDADGVNVIEKIYNFENLDKYSSNQIAFALLALDSKNYKIPENAKWSREDMIEALLSFQKLSGDDEGGFGLGGSETAALTAITLATAIIPIPSTPEIQQRPVTSRICSSGWQCF